MKKNGNTPRQKRVTILRRPLLEKVPVSDLCRKPELQPTVFYLWQKEVSENGAG